MLNDEILTLRKKLNSGISDGKKFEEIYKESTELDKLISEYYKQKKLS